MRGVKKYQQMQTPVAQTEQGPSVGVKHGKFEVTIDGWAAIAFGVLALAVAAFYVDRRWPHIRQGAKAKLRRKRRR